MRYLALSLLLLACCSGCVSRSGSYSGPVPSGIVDTIAGDAAGHLASLYPPGLTTLEMLPASTGNSFDKALDNRLRTLGFTISQSGLDALALSYILDCLDPDGSYYLQVRLSDGKAFARVYTASGQAEAGRTASPIEFIRPKLQEVQQQARSVYQSARQAAQ